MNRRKFFKQIGLVTAAFTVLPSATLYNRKWKANTLKSGEELIVPNPACVAAPYEVAFMFGCDYAFNPINVGPPPTTIINRNTDNTSVSCLYKDPAGNYRLQRQCYPTRLDINQKEIPPFIKVCRQKV